MKKAGGGVQVFIFAVFHRCQGHDCHFAVGVLKTGEKGARTFLLGLHTS
jgi:hypothetical protein